MTGLATGSVTVNVPRIQAQPLALDRDAAVMRLHELLGDGEAQTETAMVARDRGVGLPEPVEHEREKRGVDARAVV
jgi:hypothetical protein